MAPSLQIFASIRPGAGDYSTEQARLIHGKAVHRALVSITEYVLYESLKLVPIDTGDLANSAQAYVEGVGFNSVGVVSYSTSYAVYVHEDRSKAHGETFNARHSWEIATGAERTRRPQESAKFLQIAVDNSHDVMQEMLEAEVMFPGSSRSFVQQAHRELDNDRRTAGVIPFKKNPFRLR